MNEQEYRDDLRRNVLAWVDTVEACIEVEGLPAWRLDELREIAEEKDAEFVRGRTSPGVLYLRGRGVRRQQARASGWEADAKTYAQNAEKAASERDALRAQLATVTAERDAARDDLAANATMLAKQTDLARVAEADLAEALSDETLRAELDDLKQQLNEMMAIKSFHEEGDRIDMTFAGDLMHMISDVMVHLFTFHGGINYVTWNINTEDLGALELVLQRRDGATPSELQARVAKERDELRAQLATVTAERDAAQLALVNRGSQLLEMQQAARQVEAERDAALEAFQATKRVLAEWQKEAKESQARYKTLEEQLAANARLLAQQTDLATVAEIKRDDLRRRVLEWVDAVEDCIEFSGVPSWRLDELREIAEEQDAEFVDALRAQLATVTAERDAARGELDERDRYVAQGLFVDANMKMLRAIYGDGMCRQCQIEDANRKITEGIHILNPDEIEDLA